MFRFKNVEELDKFLEEMFDFGLGTGFNDFADFVGDSEFCIDLGESEDMVLVLNDEKYYVVESHLGVKFVAAN